MARTEMLVDTMRDVAARISRVGESLAAMPVMPEDLNFRDGIGGAMDLELAEVVAERMLLFVEEVEGGCRLMALRLRDALVDE
jgi:hypothetical protein